MQSLEGEGEGYGRMRTAEVSRFVLAPDALFVSPLDPLARLRLMCKASAKIHTSQVREGFRCRQRQQGRSDTRLYANRCAAARSILHMLETGMNCASLWVTLTSHRS